MSRSHADTIAAAIFAENKSQNAAVRDPSGGSKSYADLSGQVDRVVAAVVAAGLRAGDRIATVTPRGVVGLTSFLAVSTNGVCCPLNSNMRTEEFASAFAAMGITALVMGQVHSAAEDVARAMDLPVIFLDAQGEPSTVVSGRSILRKGEAAPPGTALLLQTSGTTSAPKVVPLTHANILNAMRGIVKAFALGPDDLCLNPMPLHHTHGLVTAGLASLLAGSAVCCATGFSPNAFDEVFTILRPTWFTASPAMHLALREFYAREGTKPSDGHLRFFRSSSAPLPAAVIADLETLFRAPLTETYGLTETASMICANPLPPGVRKPGSVGVAIGSEIRTVDDQGFDLAPGGDGEILARGPSVFNGYLGQGVERSATFYGDWLRTGDVGHLDSDGYLFIVGRTKELIKRGGLSVYPAEVDNALVSHPNVVEAAAFPVPHPTLGEELAAAIVATPGPAQPAEGELRDYLAARLSTYKVPAVILVVPRLPKSETGKILRRDLARHFADLLAPRNEAATTDLESELLALWQTVLGRADFGVSDNLLLLGADPLRAAYVAKKAGERLARTLSAKQMVAMPTIRAMAAHFASQTGAV